MPWSAQLEKINPKSDIKKSNGLLMDVLKRNYGYMDVFYILEDIASKVEFLLKCEVGNVPVGEYELYLQVLACLDFPDGVFYSKENSLLFFEA